MKRILALLMVLVLCLGVCGLTGCGTKKVLKVGMTEYAPMNYKDENGEWTGFDTEFAQKAAKELGYDDVEFIIINWDNKFFELESGAIDCIWNGMTITEEALKNTSVSDPYAKNAQVVVMNKADAASYTGLAGLTIAVENGGAACDLLNDMGITDYVPKTAQTDALTEVNTGAAQACLIDITMANNMITADSNFKNLVVVEELAEEEYGIAFKKDSELTAKMNEIIKTYKEDGTFDALAKKYNITIAE